MTLCSVLVHSAVLVHRYGLISSFLSMSVIRQNNTEISRISSVDQIIKRINPK